MTAKSSGITDPSTTALTIQFQQPSVPGGQPSTVRPVAHRVTSSLHEREASTNDCGSTRGVPVLEREVSSANVT